MKETKLDILAAKIAERITIPRWLKLTAAVKYSGYGRPKLIELAEQDKIIGYQDPDSLRGDWIFDKESIDEYRLSHVFNSRQKILSIMKSL